MFDGQSDVSREGLFGISQYEESDTAISKISNGKLKEIEDVRKPLYVNEDTMELSRNRLPRATECATYGALPRWKVKER